MDKDDADIYVCMCIHIYVRNITQLLKKKNEILPFVKTRVVLELLFEVK